MSECRGSNTHTSRNEGTTCTFCRKVVRILKSGKLAKHKARS